MMAQGKYNVKNPAVPQRTNSTQPQRQRRPDAKWHQCSADSSATGYTASLCLLTGREAAAYL